MLPCPATSANRNHAHNGEPGALLCSESKRYLLSHLLIQGKKLTHFKDFSQVVSRNSLQMKHLLSKTSLPMHPEVSYTTVTTVLIPKALRNTWCREGNVLCNIHCFIEQFKSYKIFIPKCILSTCNTLRNMEIGLGSFRQITQQALGWGQPFAFLPGPTRCWCYWCLLALWGPG